MTDIAEQVVATWNGRLKLRVKIAGSGPPLVYLHPETGLRWDPFLSRLCERYTVYAPEFPGFHPADSFAIHQVDDIFDLVLAYEGALRALDLVGAPVVGASFGGMLAAELAACFPGLFNRVVLLAPQGLWNEAHPWTLDYLSAFPPELNALLFADPQAEGARAMFAPHGGPQEALEGAVTAIWSFGCAAKFLWPIPDRGLHKRLHRVTAPTLIVWGETDAIVPVAYAREFGRAIPTAHVEVLPSCGHLPHIERAAATFEIAAAFLNAAD